VPTQASKVFDEKKDLEESTPFSASASFRSHYDPKTRTRYVLVMQDYAWDGPQGREVKVEDRVFDAFEGHTLATLVVGPAESEDNNCVVEPRDHSPIHCKGGAEFYTLVAKWFGVRK
jgi:hypothetical protein